MKKLFSSGWQYRNREIKTKFKKKDDRCPNCGDVLILRRGKFGMFMGCSNYPRCRYTKNIY